MAKLISQPLTATLVFLAAIIPLTEALCSNDMATALAAGGFGIFAHALHAHSVAPSTPATYLAPPDTALLRHPALDGDALRRHVSVAGALAYQSLLRLPAGTSLGTLHHNATLLVGAADGERVSLNGVLIAVPNLFFDGSCAVHGINGPLVPISSSSGDLS